MFIIYDTTITGSGLLNGSWDDNGTGLPGPVTCSGDLSGFPVRASSDADGIWDVVLSTALGSSAWEGIATTLVEGTVTVGDVAGCWEDVLLPRAQLHQNHPNPFSPQTVISFDLPGVTAANLGVYDVDGRLVRVLLNGEIVGPGRWEAVWDGCDESGYRVATGVYFCRLDAEGYSETRTMVLSR